MTKRTHEIRDPIHTFIRLDTSEREVVDTPAVQRLRHIHQLAMSHLVYPGATHRRFEHSLGVMELAGRVFDVVTLPENIYHESVRGIVPKRGEIEYGYWRRVLRMAALCHDVGHLPFSHAAEHELLPAGWDHERLTVSILRGVTMEKLWNEIQKPPLNSLDIVKLAVGPKKCAAYAKSGALPEEAAKFTDWESILAEIIVGDAFGVDRMDYLLRDSYHAGVAYGRFDYHRLIDTMRILPKSYEQESKEPALGVEEGGLHSAESLLLARYFMYTQVYFHPIRRIYDVHLRDFLAAWLKDRREDGRFSTAIDDHLRVTDNEVMAAILEAARDSAKPGHDPARRIVQRDHFHRAYQWNPVDAKENPAATDLVWDAARSKFGAERVRRDRRPAKSEGVDFPVITDDHRVASSRELSETLQRIPAAAFDFVFVDGAVADEAKTWLQKNRETIIRPPAKEEADEPTSA
ncbi:MAG: HD domain-containing protein [Phycisphaerae bacterium]